MSALPTREEIAEIIYSTHFMARSDAQALADALLARLGPAFDRLATLEHWIQAHGEHCAITPSADEVRREK